MCRNPGPRGVFFRPGAHIFGPGSGSGIRAQNGCHLRRWHQKRSHFPAPKTVPFSGPSGHFFFAQMQACASWRWANFWEARCRPGRRLVYINMDETSVPLQETPRVGWVAPAETTGVVRAPETERHCPLGRRRAYLSLLAFAADDPEVQTLLPQILVGNGRLLPKKIMPELQDMWASTPQLLCWRRASSWVDAKALVACLQVLRGALAPVWDDIDVILLLDCSPVHASRTAVAAISRLGFRLVMIPASMTGAMQPLDVYCFAPFKKKLRDSVEAAELADPGRSLSTAELCSLVLATARTELLQKNWAHAFRGWVSAPRRRSWGNGSAAACNGQDHCQSFPAPCLLWQSCKQCGCGARRSPSRASSAWLAFHCPLSSLSPTTTKSSTSRHGPDVCAAALPSNCQRPPSRQ